MFYVVSTRTTEQAYVTFNYLKQFLLNDFSSTYFHPESVLKNTT
jgi:hypothetical protein